MSEPDLRQKDAPATAGEGAGAARIHAGMTNRSRRTLILLALVSVAPVIASYTAYYLLPRDKQANYGELLVQPAPAVRGTLDGKPFTLADLRGKWVLITA